LKTAFYDAFIFVNDEHGVTFSDPAKDLNLKLSFIMPKLNSVLDFNTLTKREGFNTIKLNEGEAAFAASNTNIAHQGTNIWIATGGKSSRIIKIDYTTLKSNVYKTPFVQGESAQGMYSIDFANQNFGIAVGGDYTKQEANVNNIATTNDGGKTWQIQASGKNAGYTTCLKIKPNSKGKEMISVGDQHISYSSNFGKTWKKISDEKGFYVCKWVDGNTVVFAGKDKISLMKLKF